MGVVTSLALGLVMTITLVTPVAGQQLSEYQVKAAFLFNFAKFVEWPAAAGRSAQAPLTLCIVGDDPFGKTIDELVRGQSVGGRPFAVRRIGQVPRDDSCQIVYFGGLERSRAEQNLEAIKNLPILTVGDNEEAGEVQAMISFVIESSKVRFNINLEAAERSGLKMSSRLLQLARTVHDRRKN
jgi:hypothetical protein